MSRTKVVVLQGGNSNEHAVSLRSGKAVSAALQAAGYEVTSLILSSDPSEHLASLQAADIVFPVLHGAGGEDGTLQTYLETQAIPYVGSNAHTSALCFNKWRVKQLLWDNMLPTPKGELVTVTTLWTSPLSAAPFVLKPHDGGSSIDTFIVRDVSSTNKAELNAVLERYDTMLLEELVLGTEITVGVVGKTVLPVIEIVPPASGEFDYLNKYNGATQELCPPQSVAQDMQVKAQQLAAHLHHLCGCLDMSRTDMMVNESGELFVLEINTIPGMTDQSLLPKAAGVAGMTMPQLVARLVEDALTRRTARL